MLNTDAPRYATSEVLYQKPSKQAEQVKLSVVGHYSYTLKSGEMNYFTAENEVLAVLKAVQYFSASPGRFEIHAFH